MARKKVIDLNADTTVSFDKPGQGLDGYYIGAKSVTAKFGVSLLHHFQTESGTVGAWGSKQLDDKLATVQKGCMTYVRYVKKISVPNGQMKVFDVEWDDELSIDVEVPSASTSAPDAPTESSQEEESIDEAEAEAAELEAEAEEVEAPPVRALPPKAKPAAVSPASQQRVQDILNRAKKKVA